MERQDSGKIQSSLQRGRIIRHDACEGCVMGQKKTEHVGFDGMRKIRKSVDIRSYNTRQPTDGKNGRNSAGAREPGRPGRTPGKDGSK